jgi:geranylgeranyl reductase family protein
LSYRYDVIVVGGGPAGASAAFFLGQAGKRVLVLEAQKMPRYKACGGAVSTGVLEQFPFSFEPVIQSRVQAISYALGERSVTVPLEDSPLRMVMRSEFDAFLLQHARAEIRQGVRVTAVHERSDGVAVQTAAGESLEADFLIGADGANSVVARSLDLRRSRLLAAAIEIEASVPPPTLARFKDAPLLIFGELGVGYLWIFPKADHLSVGIGALHPRPRELQPVLERVMRRFDIPIQGQPRAGHPIPVFSGPERIGTARTMLAGDAAGLVDPFTGEGIRFAVKSGRLAADAILSQHTPGYTASVKQEIGRIHVGGAALTRVFYRLPRASYELALRNPALSHALMEMISDRIGYGDLLWRIVRSFPRYMITRTGAAQTIGV